MINLTVNFLVILTLMILIVAYIVGNKKSLLSGTYYGTIKKS